MDTPNLDISSDKKIELIAVELGITNECTQEIYARYLELRNYNHERRTQGIFYEIIWDIRKVDPSFPHTLQNLYKITTAFSKQGLTTRKSPNAYTSTLTGRQKMLPNEVIEVIQAHQHLLLQCVRKNWLNLGYGIFAERMNRENTPWDNKKELPIDWKWLSRKLGNGEWKNLHTGWGFQALKLSDDVRQEMTRILQWLPIYPSRLRIRRNKKFLVHCADFLRDWQQQEKNGGFHRALTDAIIQWNNQQALIKNPFMIPVKIFQSDTQESLSSLLGISTFGHEEILQALSIPISCWNSGYSSHKASLRERTLLIPLFQKELSNDITFRDFSIVRGIVKWSIRAIERYQGRFDFSRAQEIYDSGVWREKN